MGKMLNEFKAFAVNFPLLAGYVSAAGRMAVCRNGSEVADAVLQDGFYRLFLLAKECLYSLSDPSSP